MTRNEDISAGILWTTFVHPYSDFTRYVFVNIKSGGCRTYDVLRDANQFYKDQEVTTEQLDAAVSFWTENGLIT